MPMVKWNEDYIIKAYKLAKLGYSKQTIAKCLQVQKTTISNWIKNHQAFGNAIRTGRKEYKNKEQNKDTPFIEYVNGKLSKKYRKLYRQIKRLDSAGSGIEQLEAIYDKEGMRVRQLVYIHSLVQSNFRTTRALRRAGISFTTLRKWQSTDPYFTEFLDEIRFHRGNFFEDALADLVVMRDPQIIRHVNETFNADRGYRKDHNVKVESTGTVEHVVRVEDLDLSLDAQREILKQARTKHVESTEVPKQTLVTNALPAPKKKKKKRCKVCKLRNCKCKEFETSKPKKRKKKRSKKDD